MPELTYVSASQIKAFRECARKWAWRSIAKVETPQSDAQALGTVVDDEQVQPYLRDGRPFDFLRGDGGAIGDRSAYIAQAMLPFLPTPKTVEVQKKIEFPSPTWIDGQHSGIVYIGYADIWTRDSKVIPGCAGGVPGVADTKTTSSISKYAKSEKELAHDEQAIIYAFGTMFETRAREVDLAWIYGQTRGATKGDATRIRVHADHVAEQFKSIDATAVELLRIRKSGAQPLDLPPNPDQCNEYGGCPYRDRCNLSPAQIIDAHDAKRRRSLPIIAEDNMSDGLNLFERLKAQQAAANAAQARQAAPTSTTPAPEAPAAMPSWMTAPVDPLRAAHAAGQPYTTSAPAAPTPPAINPPESALPPAPAVGAAAPAEDKPKRGRPKKEEQPAAATAASGETVRVVWGAERVNVGNYQHVEVGPFELTTAIPPGVNVNEYVVELHARLARAAEAARDAKVKSYVAAAGVKS